MMSDLIDRQAAIGALKEHRALFCDNTPDTFSKLSYAEKSRVDELDMAIATLINLPSAQPKRKTGRWIPCSERLPEDGERVLATHLGGLNPNRQVIEHIYQNGEFTCGWDMDINMDSPTFGQRYMGEVIAWMPLPEPYREGE